MITASLPQLTVDLHELVTDMVIVRKPRVRDKKNYAVIVVLLWFNYFSSLELHEV